MQHTESDIKIYYTKEYSRFRVINGNRQLNELKIKRIIKDIDEGIDVLRYCPVIVNSNNDNLDLIDGQHRFYVSKILKRGVWYIISKEISLVEIAKINSNTDRWKDQDFIHCYVQQGNENYKKLQSFLDEYKFPIGVSITMLTLGYLVGEGSGTAGGKHKFRNGGFVIKEEEKAHELARQIKLFSAFPNHTSGAFAEAIGRIIKAQKIAINDLLKKFEKDPSQLNSCKNAKTYLIALESIYNAGNRTRQVIF